MDEVRSTVRNFIIDNFLFGMTENFKDHTSFLDEGIIDSTGVLELVSFIEETFSIKVDDEDLVPENLDSVDNVVSFVMNMMAVAEKAV